MSDSFVPSRRKESRQSVTVRTGKELADRLTRAAEESGLSLNSFAVQALEYALKHYEKDERMANVPSDLQVSS